MDYISLNTFVENKMYKTIIQNSEIIIGKVISVELSLLTDLLLIIDWK